MNTDVIHIGRSIGINVISTNIDTRDDNCISLRGGSKQVTNTNVTCGPRHGIGVGNLEIYNVEETIEGIIVEICTLMDISNDVRIKTCLPSPTFGTTSDMYYEDIMMVNVSNPIIIDQEYYPYNQCNKKVKATKLFIFFHWIY